MKEELKQKDLELEASRKQYEELLGKFDNYKIDYDANMNQLIKEKFEKHLHMLLNEVKYILLTLQNSILFKNFSIF